MPINTPSKPLDDRGRARLTKRKSQLEEQRKLIDEEIRKVNDLLGATPAPPTAKVVSPAPTPEKKQWTSTEKPRSLDD